MAAKKKAKKKSAKAPTYQELLSMVDPKKLGKGAKISKKKAKKKKK